MRNTQTYGQAIEQAQADVARRRLELQAAEKTRDELITEALTAGASFRDMGRQLGVSATTVMRRYGVKGEINDHVSGLDLPVGSHPEARR